jgi:hypothetical protein
VMAGQDGVRQSYGVAHERGLRHFRASGDGQLL